MYDVRDEFLAEYKNQPCLWDPTKKNYRDYSAIAKAKQCIALKFEWATGMCICFCKHYFSLIQRPMLTQSDLS